MVFDLGLSGIIFHHFQSLYCLLTEERKLTARLTQRETAPSFSGAAAPAANSLWKKMGRTGGGASFGSRIDKQAGGPNEAEIAWSFGTNERTKERTRAMPRYTKRDRNAR